MLHEKKTCSTVPVIEHPLHYEIINRVYNCGCQGSKRGREWRRSGHGSMRSRRGPGDRTVLSWLWLWSHQTTHVIKLHRKPIHIHKHTTRQTLETTEIWIKLRGRINVNLLFVELRCYHGETGWRIHGNFIYYFLQLYVYLLFWKLFFYKSED